MKILQQNLLFAHFSSLKEGWGGQGVTIPFIHHRICNLNFLHFPLETKEVKNVTKYNSN